MKKNFSKPVIRCQISNSKNLESLLFLGFLPPVNTLRKIGSILNEEITFPAELLYCSKSKLVQLGCIVDKEILFPYSYPYTSSTTKVLRENFAELYKHTNKIVDLNENDLIIDIGSNDGNLLSNFKKKHRVLGVTPEKIGKIAIKRGIPTIINYFDKKTVNKIIKKFGKAKIITATNVFAHIDNINQIVKNIIKTLDKDGVFISESHYLLPLIKTVQYDTIYHEHLRYYSVQSLNYLLKKHNMEIIETKEIPTHGGSIRVFAARKGIYKVSKNVKYQLNKESKFLNKKSFNQFRDNVVNSKIKLFNLINKLKKEKKIIFGVGAPSRASTMINYLGLDQDIINCVLEIDGSYKIGHYIPGTKIPIINEEILKKSKPDFLMLFSWHIKKELKNNLRRKGFKGKFIIPLPNPKIEV